MLTETELWKKDREQTEWAECMSTNQDLYDSIIRSAL